MKVEDTAKDKVQKICDVLKRETLQPAEAMAKQIVEDAQRQAEKIIKEAKNQVTFLQKQAEEEIARAKNVCQSSLHQACKQAIQALAEDLENKFFNEELPALLQTPLQSPQVLAQLVQVICHAIEKQGIEADLEVIIPKTVSPREINALLLNGFVDKLKGESVTVGPIAAGVQVRIAKENMKIDVTDQALKELLAQYIRKDFREMLFKVE